MKPKDGSQNAIKAHCVPHYKTYHFKHEMFEKIENADLNTVNKRNKKTNT